MLLFGAACTCLHAPVPNMASMPIQAVAGSAGEIGVISLVEARVVSLITGDLVFSVCVLGGPSVCGAVLCYVPNQNVGQLGRPSCSCFPALEGSMREVGWAFIIA